MQSYLLIFNEYSVTMFAVMAAPNDVEKKVSDALLDKGIVTFSFEPPFVYTTGLNSPIYTDNRMLISFPKERAYVVNEMVNLIKENNELKDVEYISSSLSYAAPFGILIAEALELPLILIRGERRTHGKRNKIEGHLPKGAKVLVVEDIVSTAAYLIDNVNAVRENGGIVSHAVAVVDYELNIARKTLLENKVKVSVLVKGMSIVDEAVKRGLLKGKEKDEVVEWFRDPIKWGEVRGYYSNTNN